MLLQLWGHQFEYHYKLIIMSRSGKGEKIGMRCVECNKVIYMQYRTQNMKLEKKTVSGSKKYCSSCKKRVELKEFTRFHYSDKQKKKKSARNQAKAAAAEAAAGGAPEAAVEEKAEATEAAE